jgi:hypothetical protein
MFAWRQGLGGDDSEKWGQDAAGRARKAPWCWDQPSRQGAAEVGRQRQTARLGWVSETKGRRRVLAVRGGFGRGGRSLSEVPWGGGMEDVTTPKMP